MQGDPALSLWINAVAIPAAIALGAVVMQLATRSGSHGSAFGRVAFAVEVPGAMFLVLDAVLAAVAEVVRARRDDPVLLMVDGALLMGVFVWTLALLFIGARAGHAGRGAAGCATLLSVALFGIVMLVVLAVGGGFALEERPSTRTGGRIEMSQQGFAVTFPEDWSITDDSAFLHELYFGDLEPEDATLFSTLLQGEHPEASAYCLMLDWTEYSEQAPPFRSVEEATDDQADFRREDDRVSAIEIGYHDFPAGRTGHPHTQYPDYESDEFFYAQGRWFVLRCDSIDPEPDYWRSIAESFEFLRLADET